MGQLIADAGATKTIWIMPGSGHQPVITRGIQPAMQVDSEIESVIYDDLFMHNHVRSTDHIIFYGAGCSAWNNAERIRKILKAAFSITNVEVFTDLQGAGRSVFGDEQGIILISGTGSSAGYMRDGQLIDQMNQPVWPQGDTGSGAHIGSIILNDYFSGDIPEGIRQVIDQHRKLSEDDLFVQFQNPDRSKMIAAKALGDIVMEGGLSAEEKNYLDSKASDAFSLWIEDLRGHFKLALQKTEVALCGSVAVTFEPLLRDLFSGKGITIQSIVKDPSDGLLRYHSKANNL